MSRNLRDTSYGIKICIVSDSHDRSAPLVEAIVSAQSSGAQAVIHCGDLISVNTLRASLKLGIPIHAVHGNIIGDVAALYRMMAKSAGLFIYHGQEAMLEFGGHKIFVTHMPHHGHAFACTGDYDLVCHGHSHTAHVGTQAYQWQKQLAGQSWFGRRDRCSRSTGRSHLDIGRSGTHAF